MKNCPACHRQNADDVAICSFCGQAFELGSDFRGTKLSLESNLAFVSGDMIAGRYEVVKELGRGGMGVVYLVKDTRIQNRLVALKMIHSQLVENPQARQRFEQEVGICLGLMHPNIVRVHNLDEWQSLQYFTMEYIEGQSLRQLIQERKAYSPPFTLTETVAVITPLLEALSYAHRHLIHRDIKPENVIVTGELPNVQVKILDFGIAKTLSPSRFTKTAQTLGTAYYMAPEQMHGGEVNHRSDLYSVGMVFYEMLTGQMALGAFEPPTELVSDLPQEIDAVVRKALSPKPEKRYADANEMQAALKRIAAQYEWVQKQRGKEEEISTLQAKGQSLYAERKWNNARDTFKHLLELEPENQEARNLLHQAEENAEKLMRLVGLIAEKEREGSFQVCLQAIDEAIKIHPNGEEIEEIRRRIEDTLARQHQKKIENLFNRASGAAQGRYWKEAAVMLKELLSADPQSQEAEKLLAQVEESEQALRKSLRAAEGAHASGNYVEGIRHLEQALPLAVDETVIQAKIDSFQKALAMQQKDGIDKLFRDGQAAFKNRRWTEARRLLTQMLEQGGDDSRAKELLENAISNQGRLEVFETRYTEAKRSGNEEQELSLLNEMIPLSENEAVLRETFSKKKREMEGRKRVKEAQDLMTMAQSAIDERQWEKAEKLLKPAIKMDPENDALRNLIAGVTEKKKELEKLEGELSKSEAKGELIQAIAILDSLERLVQNQNELQRKKTQLQRQLEERRREEEQKQQEAETEHLKAEEERRKAEERRRADAKRKKALYMWAAGVIVLIVGAYFSLSYILRPATGTLFIETEPSGAQVRLINYEKSYKPGLELKAGWYQVSVLLEGYHSLDDQVEVKASKDNRFLYKLKKVVTTGVLVVNSTPSGASVYLNGQLIGQTPQRVESVVQGRHRVLLKIDGHEEWSKEIEVKVDSTIEVQASLKKIITTGSIAVRSEPSGASVYLNGQTKGKTPGRIEDVASGSHLMELKLDGYKDWSQQVEVKAGRSVEVMASLGLRVAPSTMPTRPESVTPTATPPLGDPIGCVAIKKGQPIHIAYWMVVAGGDSSLGIDTRRGVEIAIQDKGGMLLGYPIKLSGQDTGCNAEGGQAAATKLASDPSIVAAVGSNCSSEARPGAPILWKAGISTVSPSNTSPYLTDPKRGKEYDGYLRTAHNDKIQGAVAAEFAFNKLGVRKAATVHDGSFYAEQLQAVFAESFKKLGGTITSQEAVAPTDTDMRPVLTKIATGKPEFIYFPIFIAAGGHLARQAKEVAGLEKTALMSADGTFSPDFYKAAGDAAIGMYHSSPDFSAFGPGYKDFLAKHQKKYGEKPIAPFHAHGYDAAMMIFAAIEKTAVKDGDTLYICRQKLRDALYATKGMKGLTGTITCNNYGDCADPHISVYQQTAENIKKLVNPEKPYWNSWTPTAPTPSLDPLGMVKIEKNNPIHLAYWMVVAGPDASLGVDTKRGVEIAIADKGGKLLGHPIKLSGQDTGCNSEGGQTAATKLASDPTIVAAIGSNCSSEARPGAPILWKAGIPTVSPSNTAPYLTDPNRGKEYEGYLRTSHNDKVQGVVAAEFAFKKLGVKTAATIHDGSAYAEQLQAVFAETFKKLGGTITAQEAVAPTDTDMRPVLTKIASRKPELIYYPIFIAAGAHITRQAKALASLEKTYLMSADAMFSPDFYKAAGDTAIGMFFTSPDFSAFTAGYKDFLAKHQKKYGEKPIAPFHTNGYDAAMMIFNAIEKVAVKDGDTLYIGRKALRDALYATKGMRGLTGNLTCNQYGDCADPHIAVYQLTAENLKKLANPETPYWKPY